MCSSRSWRSPSSTASFRRGCLACFCLYPVWFPSWAPAYTQVVYMASALILSTLTIMVAGVPAALYERFVAEAKPATVGLIWLTGTVLLTLPAIPNVDEGARLRCLSKNQAASASSKFAAASMSALRILRRWSASESSPQCSICQSSSTWAAAHAASTSSSPASTASASKRRARQRRHQMKGGQPERFVAQFEVDADGADRLARLLDMHDTLGKYKSRAKRRTCPVDHRIPGLGLPLDQFFGGIGAVAEQIGRGEPQDVLQHRLRVGRHAVDRGIDEPRHRHGDRIDVFLLRRELVGDQLSRGRCRQRQDRLCRRAHRLAIEVDDKALGCGSDGDVLVEALRQRRLHLELGPAHRVRIGKIFARLEVVQYIAHSYSAGAGTCLRIGRLTMIRPAAIRPRAKKIFQVSGSPSSAQPHNTLKAGDRKAKLERPAAG